MVLNEFSYIKFIELAWRLVITLPCYSNKYSRKDFTQQQLLILLILKQKLQVSYDGLLADLHTRSLIQKMIGLKRLPAASTIKMFARRMKSTILHQLLGDCIHLTDKKKLKIAIDATGFHVEDGSYHYRKRLGKQAKVRKNVKSSIVVETDEQVVIAAKFRKSKAHDIKDYAPLIKKAKSIMPCLIVVLDKGYDAESSHELAHALGMDCIIPPRNEDVPVHRTKGMYRKKMKRGYSKKKYHQRSKVETVNFVVKKMCGAVVHARKWCMQVKEMLFKLLAYNLYRLSRI